MCLSRAPTCIRFCTRSQTALVTRFDGDHSCDLGGERRVPQMGINEHLVHRVVGSDEDSLHSQMGAGVFRKGHGILYLVTRSHRIPHVVAITHPAPHIDALNTA